MCVCVCTWVAVTESKLYSHSCEEKRQSNLVTCDFDMVKTGKSFSREKNIHYNF